MLNDQFYPGWQATIDGAPTTIYKVNYFARAVFVPATISCSSYTARKASLIGSACVAATLGAFILALFLCLRRRTGTATPLELGTALFESS